MNYHWIFHCSIKYYYSTVKWNQFLRQKLKDEIWTNKRWPRPRFFTVLRIQILNFHRCGHLTDALLSCRKFWVLAFPLGLLEIYFDVSIPLTLFRSVDAICVSKNCSVSGLMTLFASSWKCTFLRIVLTVFYWWAINIFNLHY